VAETTAPHGRVCRDGSQPLHRAPNRLEIKKFVRTARRYRTVQIKVGRQLLTAAEPLPDDLAEALTKIRGGGAH
jgi:hypothetical protein